MVKVSEELKRAMRARLTVPPADLLSTGSTLLNLALSNNWRGGFAKGKYFLVVGDSESGKTWLTMQTLAEATRNIRFKDYRLIYDDVEHGALMDLEHYFGKTLAKRVEPPYVDEHNKPVYSEWIEDFYFGLDDAFAEEEPFIWVEDSIDALNSEADDKKFYERKAARAKGKKASGDFGDGKAKVNSRNMRRVARMLRDSGSILLVINQERDNPNAGLFESNRTHSGGRALKFYGGAQIWMNRSKRTIKRKVMGKDRVVGHYTKIRVVKNRLTGRARSIELPIINEYGMDDLGSCVDWLVDEGHWSKNTSGVVDTGDDFEGKYQRASLLRKIEEEELEVELRSLVGQIWNRIDEACVDERKPRYR